MLVQVHIIRKLDHRLEQFIFYCGTTHQCGRINDITLPNVPNCRNCDRAFIAEKEE